MMEFGEAVLFAKFLREQGKVYATYFNMKPNDAKRIQKENPGLWFKWLAWKAARKHAQKDS